MRLYCQSWPTSRKTSHIFFHLSLMEVTGVHIVHNVILLLNAIFTVTPTVVNRLKSKVSSLVIPETLFIWSNVHVALPMLGRLRLNEQKVLRQYTLTHSKIIYQLYDILVLNMFLHQDEGVTSIIFSLRERLSLLTCLAPCHQKVSICNLI